MTSFQPDIFYRDTTPGDSFQAGNRKFVATPPFPSAAQSVAATPGDTQVTITWTAPATGVVDGYRLGRSASPGGAAFEITRPADATSYTFVGLTNAYEYEFYVEPYNDYGQTRTNVDSIPVAGPSSGSWASNNIAPSFLRPYATTSIWKRKIDPAAGRVAAGTAGMRTTDGYSGKGGLENVHFFDLTDDDSQTVARYARASSFSDKCANRGAFVSNIKMPNGWQNRPGLSSTGKNNQINVLGTNGSSLTFYQATMACSASELTAGDPVYNTGTLGGSGLQGARGASRVANGGCLRPPDVVPGNAIEHPLELVADQKYLYGPINGGPSNPGFRWPALSRDSNYLTLYSGSVPQMTMGSLVSIPSSFNFASNGITNAFILKLGQCLKDYGAYVVDITAWKAPNSAWSLGCDSQIVGQITTGLGFDANISQWFKLIEALQVVDTTDHPENPN